MRSFFFKSHIDTTDDMTIKYQELVDAFVVISDELTCNSLGIVELPLMTIRFFCIDNTTNCTEVHKIGFFKVLCFVRCFVDNRTKTQIAKVVDCLKDFRLPFWGQI